jgi:chromate transporter
VFPLGVILSAAVSAWLVKDEKPQKPSFTKSIKWRNLTIFFAIFFIVGFTGLLLTKYKTESKLLKPVILFENTYRMGALSFGGGNVLAAMTVEQYVDHKKRMSLDELNTGLGLIQAAPGPNFNLAVYTNSIAMKNDGSGFGGQLLGSLIGLIAVFMPGTLLVLFAYPIWEKLNSSVYLRRSINGIFSISVGFILTACLIINQNFILKLSNYSNKMQLLTEIFVCFVTAALLLTKKIPTPFIVLFAIILGWIMA